MVTISPFFKIFAILNLLLKPNIQSMENEKVTSNKLNRNYSRIENILGASGKLTPQAIEFEESVLGALMIDDNAITEVLSILRPEMFYVEANQHIYNAIKKLFSASQPIDLLTVSNQLKKDKLLDIIGGASYLAKLTNRLTSSANVEYYARIVMEKFILRELISNCNNIITDAYDDSKDVLDQLDDAESKIFSIIESNFNRDSKELGDVVNSALEELTEMRNSQEELQGVPCGIRAVDSVTGGWQKSDLIILAARPGMGKTAFVLTIARNAALDFDTPVALFSLEMSSNQLVHRLFSMESGIPSDHISKGNLTDVEWSKLWENVTRLNSSNLIIDDTPALSVFDLRAKCRRLKQKYDIQMVIIDYLQLMQTGSDSSKSGGNREQEISYISRSLKALAKELNIPVIALSQLNRSVETRGGSKRPQLSDLRESGSIEQDADMVLFIYRPEYYQLELFEDNTPAAGLAEIMFAKNRHGSTSNVRIQFKSQLTKFCDKGDDLGSSFSSPSDGISPNDNFQYYDSGINGDSDTDLSKMDFSDDLPYTV